MQQLSDKEIIEIQHEEHMRDVESIGTWVDLSNVLADRVPNQSKQFSKDLRDHLKARNYKEPAPIQKMVLPYLLQEHTKERFAYIKAPTGTGKTLSFILPLLFFFDDDYLQQFSADQAGNLKYYPYALILVAQHALLRQIRDDFEGATPNSLKKKGFIVQHFDKGNEEANIVGQILCGVPGTILKLIQKQKIQLDNVRYIVIDEADNTIINDKNSLALQIIGKLIDSKSINSKIIVCGATINMQELKEHFITKMRLREPRPPSFFAFKNFEFRFELDNIYHFYHDQIKNKEQMVAFLIDLIKNTLGNLQQAQIMIFFNKKVECDEITKLISQHNDMKFLIENNYICEIRQNTAQEGQVDREEQQRLIEEFRSGKRKLMLCSDLMGRGMNFRSVRLVINYGVPRMGDKGKMDWNKYDQRVGRTGRMEDLGVGLTILNPENNDLRQYPPHETENENEFLKLIQQRNIKTNPYKPIEFIKQLENVYDLSEKNTKKPVQK